MTSSSERPGKRREPWATNWDDFEFVLKPVNFPKADIDNLDDNDATIAVQCLSRMQKICDSLQQDNVMITDRLCLSQRIWDLHIYRDEPSAFPVQNVQIKCNILSSLSELVRNLRKDDLSDTSDRQVVRVLDYLHKLSEAALFSGAAKQLRPVERVSLLDSSRLRRPLSGSFSHGKSGHSGAGAGVRANAQKKKELGMENINTFLEYKPLIVSLQSRLKLLDQSNRRNDIIFDFVLHNVCNFILDDCKILLVDYIERGILNV